MPPIPEEQTAQVPNGGVTAASPDGQTSNPVGFQSTSTDAQGDDDGKPFATVNGQDFATPEDLSKWYDEQRAQGKTGLEVAEEPADPNAPKDAPPERTDEEILTSLKERGGIYAHEAYAPAALEFERTGDVSPETLAATAAGLGVPLEFAQSWVDNQKELRAAVTTASSPDAQAAAALAVNQPFYDIAGGKDAYAKLTTWATTEGNLSAEEVAAYDNALETNPATAKVLLAGFKAKMDAAGDGGRPRDLTSEAATVQTQTVEGYESSAEMQKDINDPRYQSGDAKFQRMVQAKIAASKF